MTLLAEHNITALVSRFLVSIILGSDEMPGMSSVEVEVTKGKKDLPRFCCILQSAFSLRPKFDFDSFLFH
jgi:hypothetical protein